MLTVDYGFYAGTYKGTRTEAEFDRLAVFASAYIEEITLGRVPDDPDELEDEDAALRVRLAFCAVVDTHGAQEVSAGIASETNDGISVSYVADEALRRRSLYNAAAVYLGATGLLFRGVI